MPSKSKEIKETIFSDGFPSQRLLLRIIFHTSTAGISNHSKGGLVGGWTTPLKNSQIGNLSQVRVNIKKYSKPTPRRNLLKFKDMSLFQWEVRLNQPLIFRKHSWVFQWTTLPKTNISPKKLWVFNRVLQTSRGKTPIFTGRTVRFREGILSQHWLQPSTTTFSLVPAAPPWPRPQEGCYWGWEILTQRIPMGRVPVYLLTYMSQP